ncbi:Microsomal triglyceride transfer protein large subunit [Penaeus vannamei]|uniref:Microsomal triglyceride transfer protein large subunit n=1 Tax=Penaeus vannamei TaxID=6689 RepID=A0A3R7LWE3_PENVA|nr:Microsomal triglyceride transfer protein large subunit [Penaeus vannamei]
MVDPTHVTKLKRNCKNVIPVQFFNQTNKVLGAVIDSHATASYVLNPDDKIIEKATSMETHFLRVEARKQSGAEGRSKVNSPKYPGNTAAEALRSIAKKLKKSIVTEQLTTNPEAKECISCKSLKALISSFYNTLSPKNLGTQGSAIAFVRLLRKVRESDLDTIKAILKDKKNAKIMPQLLDILAAAQTIPSHKAAMSVLNFGGPIDNPERYLLSLSLATHPSEFILQDLIKLAKKGLNNDKLYETLVLTIASVSHTFCKVSNNCKKPIITDVQEFITSKLENCKSEDCQLIYIRALKNFRKADTMETLLKYAEGKARKPAIYATRALQTMPSSYITEKILKSLERVFLELNRQHDTSVRAMQQTSSCSISPVRNSLRLCSMS